MPNHITTRVRFESPKGSDLQANALLDKLESIGKDELGHDVKVLDFEKIIPIPNHIYRGEKDEEGRIALSGKYEGLSGENNWYHWQVKNWGTKWNAYGYERDGAYIQFQTAWSHPFPVMVAISRMIPEITLVVEYADEDYYGSNYGSYMMKDGYIIKDKTIEQGAESLRFSMQVTGYGEQDIEEEVAKLEKEEEEKRLAEEKRLEEAKSLPEGEEEVKEEK